MKWAVRVVLAVAVAACRAGESVPAERPKMAVAAQPVSAEELAAYEAGRRQEINLTAAALALLDCANSAEQQTVLAGAGATDRIERDAAADGGMRVSDYHRLVSRVDSVLQRQTSAPGAAGPRIQVPQARRLDSLRVQLMVLRTRVAAEVSQPFHTRRSAVSCVQHP